MNEKSDKQKKEEKRLYDIEYRKKNKEKLKVKKAEYHKRTYDPEKEAQKRKKKMPYHLEYCRQPEYRAWKRDYDRKYRAKRYYGELWESAIVLWDLEQEVVTRSDRIDRYAINGILNKKQTRRRRYEGLNSNKS